MKIVSISVYKDYFLGCRRFLIERPDSYFSDPKQRPNIVQGNSRDWELILVICRLL